MRRILFPVDFSQRAANTATLVRAMAGRFSAEVHLLHALSYSPEVYGGMEYVGQAADVISSETLERWRREKEAKLEGFLSALWCGVKVTRAVESGDIATAVVDYARAQQCDLVMMPTHGYGPFRRMLLGSVTSKVLHDAPCAVWTDAHAEDAGAWRPENVERVLCCVDLENEAACVRLIQGAIDFARPFGAKITVFHAMPAAGHRPGYPDLPGDILSTARDRVWELAHRAGIEPVVHVEGGWPVEALKRYAVDNRPDLLVIGRGQHRGLGRLGSHAYAMIREAPCPVLSI
jgi:nucleotide-binding universal stress UspA family protein